MTAPPGQSTAVVGLGANLGDRAGCLQRGLDLLAAKTDVTVRAVSRVYETDPVGGPEQPAFLNAVCLLETTLPPLELLGVLHDVEQACGRVRDVHWGPRTLDLDVISVGALVCSGPSLTLPHPLAHERAFVLVPWLDLDPAAELPGRGAVAELSAATATAGVRRCADVRLELPVGGRPA
ncbi:MAG: 2-amino-4-hydroxy-6-hydroxymethyldihydropteridine diphosphokinase [Actinomycetota bacterium]|nr:2-amino-4-hydroxy-6-hydroxymethyldihydropteridine diphosphokinase [Actinomycetota bacterium]